MSATDDLMRGIEASDTSSSKGSINGSHASHFIVALSIQQKHNINAKNNTHVLTKT